MGLRRDPVMWAATFFWLFVLGVGVHDSLSWLDRPFPGFMLFENRVIPSVGSPAWPGMRDGEIFQHEVVSFDGHSLDHPDQLYRYAEGVPVGTPIRYRLRSGDTEVEREIATQSFQTNHYLWIFGSLLLAGLTFGSSAFGIRYLRGRDQVTNGISLTLWIVAIFALSAMSAYGPYRFGRLTFFCEGLASAAFIHTALVFPQPIRSLERRPWLAWLPYLPVIPLIVAYQYWFMDPVGIVRCHTIGASAYGAAVFFVLASQIYRLTRPSSFAARQQSKVFVLGTVVILIFPATTAASSIFRGGQENWNLIALSASVFPLFLAYATLRHNLLEVDRLVRQSLIYGSLTMVVAGIYLGGVALSGTIFRSNPNSAGALSGMIAILSAVALLAARDRMQALVDRIFFRSAYDFRRVIENASMRLASYSDLDTIADEIESAVGGSLHPRSIELFVRSHEEAPLTLLRSSGEPDESPGALDVDISSVREPVDWVGGALAVPLRVENSLVGLLVLGRSRSGRYYGADDRRLLRVLAHQSGVAIRNALAVEEVRKLNRELEAKVEERTAELEDALSQLRESHEALERLASTDAVTGLGVRRAIMDTLNAEWIRARRYGSKLSVLMADLDHFKQINDRFGHQAGDTVLQGVSQLLRESLRTPDSAGRYGGEEILAVLPQTGAQGAHLVAERWRESVESACFQAPDGRPVSVTLSVGVASFSASQTTPDDLVALADAALYRAKDAGRNRVELEAGADDAFGIERGEEPSTPEKD